MKMSRILWIGLFSLIEGASVASAEPGLRFRKYKFNPFEGALAPISTLHEYTPTEDWVWTGGLSKGSWGEENYLGSWEGVLLIEESDTYSFGTKSDDGSVLYIDLNEDGDYEDAGELIVNNNYFQGATARTGSVALEGPRQYRFIVGYYQGGGGEELDVRWRRGVYDFDQQERLDPSKHSIHTTFELMADNEKGAREITASSATLAARLITSRDPASAQVRIYWGASDGGTDPAQWEHCESFPAPQGPGVLTASVANLAPNALYFYRTMMEDSTGSAWASSSSAWTTAPISVTCIRHADEASLEPGILRFSRPEAAAAVALSVAYSVGGSAIAGTHYEPLSGSITFPAGATTVEVAVTPLRDWASDASPELTVAVAAGAYVADPTIAHLTIENAALPVVAGRNLWIGSGNASNPANWSLGRVPTSNETVWLGAFSSGDLLWDAPNGGLPTVVAGWLQEEGYTGRVVIPTTFPLKSEVFTTFVVRGDMQLDGGLLSHPEQPSLGGTQYRLALQVDGDLSLGPNAQINVDERGYRGGDGHGPGSQWKPEGGTSVASHGGFSGLNGNNGQARQIYGSVFAPRLPGSCGQAGAGGGAIALDIGGALSIEGTISAIGTHTKWGGGSGGSIRVRAATLSGSGTITADGAMGVIPWDEGQGWGPCGGGGRVAVTLTRGDSLGGVRLWARGGAKWSDDRRGGPGTVYQQFAGESDGAGTIIIDTDWRTSHGLCRCILPQTVRGAYSGEEASPIEDFSHATILIRNRGILGLSADLRVHALSIDGNSSLILSGSTLTAYEVYDNGRKLAPGVYTANDLNRVYEGGNVVVLSSATLLMIR